jgi:hypothetical protein
VQQLEGETPRPGEGAGPSIDQARLRGRRAWDRRLGLRAAALAAIGAAVGMLVVATTDEGGPWARRLAMWAALSPVAGALGVLAALRVAETRGELRALAALGADPVGAVRGAIVAGAAVALLGPVLAGSGIADLDALFPRPVVPRVWVTEADGALRELTQGLRMAADGTLSLVAAEAPASGALPRGARVTAALATGALALIAPLWAGMPAVARRRALVTAGLVTAIIVAFQSVAAGRAPAAVLMLPPALLLVEAGALWTAAHKEAA